MATGISDKMGGGHLRKMKEFFKKNYLILFKTIFKFFEPFLIFLKFLQIFYRLN